MKSDLNTKRKVTWSTYEFIIIQSLASQTFQGKFLFDVLRIQISK